MKPTKSHQEMIALRQLAMDDLMSQSDAQLRQEAADDGVDVDVIATALRTSLRESVAQVLRQRLTKAQQRVASPARPATSSIYPSLEALMQRVQRAFELHPELGLAFRSGKKQSETDWQTLYDDLIELGAITPDDESNH